MTNNPIITAYAWFLQRSPVGRTAVAFVVGAVLFTSILASIGRYQPMTAALRGVAFGLAFAIGYYLAEVR